MQLLNDPNTSGIAAKELSNKLKDNLVNRVAGMACFCKKLNFRSKVEKGGVSLQIIFRTIEPLNRNMESMHIVVRSAFTRHSNLRHTRVIYLAAISPEFVIQFYFQLAL